MFSEIVVTFKPEPRRFPSRERDSAELGRCFTAERNMSADTCSSLRSQAGLLGIRPQLFRHSRERFEPDDFYRWPSVCVRRYDGHFDCFV